MFMVFKPYEPVMAIPMEYYIVMCLHFGDIGASSHIANNVQRGLTTFRLNMIFFISQVPKLVSL
jgi:hypothetical protein